jgi:hypothetical protein
MPSDVRYSETLRVPLRWWAVGTMFHASVLLAFLVALPQTVAYVLTGVLVLLTVVTFLGYGGARVTVADGFLAAGRARIPVDLLTEPEVLDPQATRRAVGQGADARAYLVLRPYLKRSVRIGVNDPGDPTPYWLVSTRRPEVLAAALARPRDVSPTTRRAD